MVQLAKATSKSVYDLGKKELKSRAEFKLDDGDTKLGVNYSDKSGVVGLDVERGTLKLGYDVQREDLVFQYKRKADTGTFTFKQVVPGMKWEVVPSPVVELSTKLLDSDKWKDSLKLVYDFHSRFAYYTETLKFNKKFKVRVSGDTKSPDHAFCAGWKPDARWAKSFKLVHTPASGPLISYKLKPAKGWKLATETSVNNKVVNASLTYKALGGDAEWVAEAALPFSGTGAGRPTLKKAGLKVDFKF